MWKTEKYKKHLLVHVFVMYARCKILKLNRIKLLGANLSNSKSSFS